MVMTVERLGYTQAARQFINRIETMRVSAGRLVGHQNIGALRDQAKVVLREDGAAVLAWQAIAPTIAPAAARGELFGLLVEPVHRRRPHLPPEHAAQPSNAHTIDHGDAPMQIPVRQR